MKRITHEAQQQLRKKKSDQSNSTEAYDICIKTGLFFLIFYIDRLIEKNSSTSTLLNKLITIAMFRTYFKFYV